MKHITVTISAIEVTNRARSITIEADATEAADGALLADPSTIRISVSANGDVPGGGPYLAIEDV